MKPRTDGRLVAGLIILVAGLLLLAMNLGWLQLNWWALWWWFWPLILVLIGLRFLVANAVAYLILAGLIIGTAVWAVSYAPSHVRDQFKKPNSTSQTEVQSHQTLDEDLNEATKRLKLTLDFGAANVEVNGLDEDDKAYRAEFQNAIQINEQTSRQGDQLIVGLSQDSNRSGLWRNMHGRRAEVSLNQTVPVEFELKSGASKQDLDFMDIMLERLKLDLGASSGEIHFGNKVSQLDAEIEAGASSLTLHVPEDAGLEIVSDSGLSSNNFEEAGLTRSGDTYRSPDFASQDHKITIRLDGGASYIKLERFSL